MKLKGTNINLRKLKKSDASSITKYADNMDIARYTTLPHPYTGAEEFIKKTQKGLRKKTGYELGIEYKGEIVGMMGLSSIDKTNKNAEFGYWLGKPFWRKGFTFEAAKLMIEFGFKELELERIYAKVLTQNIASAKLLEKLGFKHEGLLRRRMIRFGTWYDAHIYSMLKEEFGK